MIKYPKYKYFYAIADFLILCASFVASEYISERIFHKRILADVDLPTTHLINVIFSLFFIFIFQNNNLYKINIFLSRSSQIVSIIKSFIYGGLILILISFFLQLDIVLGSRTVAVTFIMLGISSITFCRVVILKPLYFYFTKYNLIKRNVVIVGSGKSSKLLAEKILFENFYGINILGFIDNESTSGKFIYGNIRSLGGMNKLEKIVSNVKVDEIIIATDDIDYERLLQIIDYCNTLHLNVKLSSELFRIIPEKIVTESYSGIPLIDLSEKVNKNINIIFKRGFDVAASVLGLLVLSPLLLSVSLIIKLTSKGKVLFSQERIGKNGKKFNLYKFRSMIDVPESEEEHKKWVRALIKESYENDSVLTKIVNEKRVTRIGKFLRKTSIDELPQLFNVIKGDMSLVGPRPCLPYEYEVFDEWHKRRHSVLPGCTGVWQINGRGSVSFKDSIILDLYYVNNATPWLDLQLIIKTFPVMLTGRGAK
ncbi:MAG: sugar transferase [Bacteroidetes bacterium]|nr:sugar transferase [Bacteroidota bacterium]